jgi:hypothetical protein
MSLKEVKTDFQSHENLQELMSSMEEIETYADQILCGIQIDIKILGYNISFHKIPQRKNISIVNEFIEQSKTKQYSTCFHVNSELNQLQISHVIYQLLDTYTEELENIRNMLTNMSMDYVQQNGQISSSTSSSTPTSKYDGGPVIIG